MVSSRSGYENWRYDIQKRCQHQNGRTLRNLFQEERRKRKRKRVSYKLVLFKGS